MVCELYLNKAVILKNHCRICLDPDSNPPIIKRHIEDSLGSLNTDSVLNDIKESLLILFQM